MKTIVALVDFTDASEKVLKQAQEHASAFGSHVVLLHVVPPEPVIATLGPDGPAIPQPVTPEELKVDQARLQIMLNSLISADIKATALQFEGPVAQTALDQLQRLDPDLVIMGSHHHNALYNFFIGSVSADILKHATFPVLVLPAEVPEKAEIPVRANAAEDIRQKASPTIQPMLPA